MNDKHKAPIERRDRPGHLAPAYAEKLAEISAESPPMHDHERAFTDESHSDDPLAEELGESFVRSATSGEDDETERLTAVVAEEFGGPFVRTTGADEFARGTDESNPDSASREPFPKS